MTTPSGGRTGATCTNAHRGFFQRLAQQNTIVRARHLCWALIRRRGWFLESLSPTKLFNLAVAAGAFALKRETMRSFPTTLKIDISPLCNLHCTCCVHAEPQGREKLLEQHFHSRQRMTVEQYQRIIDEARGKASAVSLYYLGDPLMHPDLDEMCRITHAAGINAHVSTNLSFHLSDQRLRSIVQSGVTHLTVCVDGLTQDKYARTRIGGRIDLVLSNLKRLCQIRRELGRSHPKVEVQYVKFLHNVNELEAARALVREIGVDMFTDFWGSLLNYTAYDPNTMRVDGPKKRGRFPGCLFPHFAMLIKYNGDVIPCCSWRLGEQYARENPSPILGNVFETSVAEVWNSPAYRAARRIVSDPQCVERDPSLKTHFCYSCPNLFETDYPERYRRADRYTLEEVAPPASTACSCPRS